MSKWSWIDSRLSLQRTEQCGCFWSALTAQNCAARGIISFVSPDTFYSAETRKNLLPFKKQLQPLNDSYYFLLWFKKTTHFISRSFKQQFNESYSTVEKGVGFLLCLDTENLELKESILSFSQDCIKGVDCTGTSFLIHEEHPAFMLLCHLV